MSDIVFFAFVVNALNFCYGFNVDVNRPIIFTGNKNTHFGATVEFFRNKAGKWLVIGAPRDSITYDSFYNRTGNIYMCAIDLLQPQTEVTNCTELVIKRKNINNTLSNDSKLGSSILVLGTTILACAPGHMNPYSKAVVGSCMEFDKENPTIFRPRLFRLPKSKKELEPFHWAMFGFSTATGINSTFPFLVGGPNSDNQGGGISTLKGRVNFFKKGAEGPTSQPGAYFGFSMDSGLFEAGKFYYVVGRPGFANSLGNIGNVQILEFFGTEIITRKLLAGKQLGGGFGYSVCVADVNGDGYNDVLVGAPMEYINKSTSGKIITDSGAVHIFLGTKTSVLDEPITIRGSATKLARFGTSIANLLDITNDGLNDIAVGAPFEDEVGALYIYNGFNSNAKHDWEYSQRITPKDLGIRTLGFGFHISRSQMDVDDNLHGDISVGAYKSDQVYLLRSKPVVDVSVDIEFLHEQIFVNSSGLSCNEGHDMPCMTLKLGFKVDGKGIDNGLYINFSIHSDVTEETGRFVVATVNNFTTNYRRQNFDSPPLLVTKENSSYQYIVLQTTDVGWRFFRDIDNPVTVKMVFSLSDISVNNEITPILRHDVITNLYKNIHIKTNCSSYVCVPVFSSNATTGEGRLIIKEGQELPLTIDLKNTGDPAENTEVLIETNPVIEFDRVTNGSQDVDCTVITPSKLKCALKLLKFYPHQRVYFALSYVLKARKLLNIDTDHIKFEITVNTSIPEDQEISFPLVLGKKLHLYSDVNTVGVLDSGKFIISGNTPSTYSYSISYDIQNSGPSPMTGTFQILFPWRDQHAQLVEKIKIEMGKCKEPEFVDGTGLDSKTPTYITCQKKNVRCKMVVCDLDTIDADDLKTIEIVITLLTQPLSDHIERGGSNKAYFVTFGRVVLANSSFPAVVNVTDGSKVKLEVHLDKTVASEINIWYIVGGGCGGFVVLVIIVILLWKCGFFKRKNRTEINRAKRQSMIQKQRQTQYMSQFIGQALEKEERTSLMRADDKNSHRTESFHKDKPNQDVVNARSSEKVPLESNNSRTSSDLSSSLKTFKGYK